jgi:hypothetical protein
MIPTMVFSILSLRLDFFAGRDEDKHQSEEADGECDKKQVNHKSLG